MIRPIALVALSLVASPALADAVTYKGTIGNASIVMELSEDPAEATGELFGRYFYTDKGVDIPLHQTTASRSKLALAEEVPCDEKLNNCPHAQDDPPRDPPLGAGWELSIDRSGNLKGNFTLNGRNRTVDLLRVGTRPYDPAEGLQGLSSFASGLFWQGTTLTTESSPYDFLKVADHPLKQVGSVELAHGTARYWVDDRTKFQFPRIADIGDADDVPANDYLQQRHWMMSLDALYCAAQIYQGFGWNGYNFDAGTLGWWDEEQVVVHYLSPTVMTWMESGSLSCGGAHPYNHAEYYNLDVQSGVPLDLSRIFKGWVAKDYDGKIVDLETARANPRDYQWQPDADLAAFVKAHRPSDEELGLTGGEDGCPMDELIDTNLMIGFKGDYLVVFALGGLPHVIQACGQDLVEAPITELRDLLTPEAAEYFPVLNS